MIAVVLGTSIFGSLVSHEGGNAGENSLKRGIVVADPTPISINDLSQAEEGEDVVVVDEDSEEVEEHEHEGGYDTFTLHRWFGYGIILGSLINAGLGLYELNLYQNKRIPPDPLRITHRAIGYTVFSLSLIQSSIGTYNALNLIKESEGRERRFIHGTLAWTATGVYLYAGYLGYRGYYEQHRNWMLVATGLSALAGLWIIF